MTGISQPDLGAELPPQRRCVRLEESQHPHRAAQLPDQPPGASLAQPLQVPPHLVGPGRRLEPEGDRRARLAMSPSYLEGVPMSPGQVEQVGLQGAQLAPDEGADLAQHHTEPGVGEILHGGSEVDVLPSVLRQHPLQATDQAQGGMRREPGLLGDVVQIERRHLGAGGDRLGGVRRHDPEAGLHPG